MDTIRAIANWLLFESIYGIIVIAGLIYLALRVVKRRVAALPSPAGIAVSVAIIGVFTLPSVPRFQFERDTLAAIEGKGWIRVINETRWGSFTEPLTLIRAPIGSFFLIMPEGPTVGGFREMLLRYDEEPKATLTEPDCSDQTIARAEADSDGQFRYTAEGFKAMTKSERAIYCEYEWTKEQEALNTALRAAAGDK